MRARRPILSYGTRDVPRPRAALDETEIEGSLALSAAAAMAAAEIPQILFRHSEQDT